MAKIVIRLGWVLVSLLLAACSTEKETVVPILTKSSVNPVTYVVVTVVATVPTSTAVTSEKNESPKPQSTLMATTPALRTASLKTTPTTAFATETAEIDLKTPTVSITRTQVTTVSTSPTPIMTSTTVFSQTTGPSPTPIPATAAPVGVVVTSLSPPPVAATAPQIYETTITIPTYGYEAGFQPTSPEDDIYPYPRLNFDMVGPPTPRSYKAVVLENGFVSITILPELGGRIYRWVDKTTGRKLLYENPVIKPTSWGYRGWWLAAGGIEWAFPVEEHGLNEWRPWNYTTGSTAYGSSITVSSIEERTGMEVGATLSLDTGHAYLVIQPWARNNTAEDHPYQLWLNAMLALNKNTISSETQLIVPASEVIIHTTADGGLPGSGSQMSWPFHNGRDMSRYGNWQGWGGFFAPSVSHGFVGVYDYAIDQGIVRAYNPGWPSGTKFFLPSTLSASIWTDDNSNYLEMWSGATSSFWANATLASGDSVGWTEFWYPVHGMAGFTYANRSAALKLTEADNSADISVAVSGGITGEITLWVGGHQVAAWPLTIYPGQTFRANWTRPTGIEGALGLRLAGSDGSVIAQTGLVP